MDPIMQFKSHIHGKNADVRIYPDRVEWSRKGWLGAGSKAALGLMTMGASLLATGIRRSEDGEIIPLNAITHIGKRRGKGLNTEVVLTTSGGDLVMRVHHGDADRIISTIHQIQRNGYTLPPTSQMPMTPPQPTPVPANAPTPAIPDVAEQLSKLGQLRDAGILTEEEFAAKKADLLSRF